MTRRRSVARLYLQGFGAQVVVHRRVPLLLGHWHMAFTIIFYPFWFSFSYLWLFSPGVGACAGLEALSLGCRSSSFKDDLCFISESPDDTNLRNTCCIVVEVLRRFSVLCLDVAYRFLVCLAIPTWKSPIWLRSPGLGYSYFLRTPRLQQSRVQSLGRSRSTR